MCNHFTFRTHTCPYSHTSSFIGAMQIDRSTKYDRQIRLWASTGQDRLEKSHVCIIGASATGSEILKNLVLPGIGAFTIIDSRLVTNADLSGNFFLQEEDLGSPIALAMCTSLLELNPDVSGYAVTQSVQILCADQDFWNQFNAVVISGHVDNLVLATLKELLWIKNIPLLVVATAGFYGTLHIVSRETTIVETHDPSKIFDLRIDRPWPELQAYSDSFVLEELDSTDHAHVPYIVIFIKALRQWKDHHGGLPPQNYTEKKEFRASYVEGLAFDLAMEANFLEASQSIHRALQITKIPNSIDQLFTAPEIEYLSGDTPLFWIYVAALKDFVAENENQLPLPGNLPDMTSKTSNYVKLQTIYRQKAENDRQTFSRKLLDKLVAVNRSEKDICQDMVSSFCKNAAFLYVSKGNLLQYSEKILKEFRAAIQSDSEQNSLVIYFGILALHRYLELETTDGFDFYLECFKSMFTIEAIPENASNVLKELFLHKTSSYHNICSLMGGIVGQEVLKILTQQYIPLDNLFVFNGVTSTSEKWKI